MKKEKKVSLLSIEQQNEKLSKTSQTLENK